MLALSDCLTHTLLCCRLACECGFWGRTAAWQQSVAAGTHLSKQSCTRLCWLSCSTAHRSSWWPRRVASQSFKQTSIYAWHRKLTFRRSLLPMDASQCSRCNGDQHRFVSRLADKRPERRMQTLVHFHPVQDDLVRVCQCCESRRIPSKWANVAASAPLRCSFYTQLSSARILHSNALFCAWLH